MFASIRNIRIFPRLIILFAVLVIISATSMIFLGSFYLNAEQTHAQAVKTSFNAQQVATTEQINLQRMNALLQARFAQIFASQNSVALQGDPSLEASGGLIENDIEAREIDFDQTVHSYDSTYEIAESPGMSTILHILQNDGTNQYLIQSQKTALDDVVNSQWRAYKQLQDQVLTQLRQTNPQYEPAYLLLYQANQKFLVLQRNWQVVVDTATTVGQAVTNLNNSEIVPLQIATMIAVILILAVIILTALIVTATISRPLRRLAALTGRIAQGDTNVRAQEGGRDEIHMVAASMNNMLDNIVQLIRETEMRHIHLQKQVEKLISEVRGAGEGDLRVQAQVSKDSLGVLASFFNHIIAQLGSLVITFKTLANEVERSTLQTYDDMAQLVESADQQIQKITVATTNVEEMAASNRQVAQRALELSQLGSEVYTTTDTGRSALQRTLEGMERITYNVHMSSERVHVLAEHSQEIHNIVRVISGIAYQTNRLALDASIQAAMAGENGKAFRAVADDIRRAAEVAKTQTSMIERIVKQVLEDIQAVSSSIHETETESVAGTASSQNAKTSFDAVFSSVERQARGIEMINQVAQQQLQVSDNVVQMMRDVSSSTQQSSQSVREEAQRMEQVAQLAEQLLLSAEVFKLREGQDIFASAVDEDVVPPAGMQSEPFFPASYSNGGVFAFPSSGGVSVFPSPDQQTYSVPRNATGALGNATGSLGNATGSLGNVTGSLGNASGSLPFIPHTVSQGEQGNGGFGQEPPQSSRSKSDRLNSSRLTKL